MSVRKCLYRKLWAFQNYSNWSGYLLQLYQIVYIHIHYQLAHLCSIIIILYSTHLFIQLIVHDKQHTATKTTNDANTMLKPYWSQATKQRSNKPLLLTSTMSKDLELTFQKSVSSARSALQTTNQMSSIFGSTHLLCDSIVPAHNIQLATTINTMPLMLHPTTHHYQVEHCSSVMLCFLLILSFVISFFTSGRNEEMSPETDEEQKMHHWTEMGVNLNP